MSLSGEPNIVDGNIPNGIEAARLKAAVSQFRDPEAAQFRNLKITKAGTICGEVNARNGFGGYNGFVPFLISPNDKVYLEDSPDPEDKYGIYSLYRTCLSST
jgi:hypothetical protein